jgi:putative endonuclease
MNHIELGKWGEAKARSFLSAKGYQILATHYQIKLGEIDIIAQDADVIVFVEVKTRRSNEYGTPAEAVNYRKQKKIITTALCYLKFSALQDRAIRFDVIEVYVPIQQGCEIHHIINAFGGT